MVLNGALSDFARLDDCGRCPASEILQLISREKNE